MKKEQRLKSITVWLKPIENKDDSTNEGALEEKRGILMQLTPSLASNNKDNNDNNNDNKKKIIRKKKI